MAYRKPTKAELQRRVTATADLLAHGVRQGDIKRVISSRFEVSPRSVERYLRRAREQLIAELDEGEKTQHRARALDVYRSVLRASDASHGERMAAQGRIDRILGLEHQFDSGVVQHEHKHQVSVKILDEVRKKPELRNRLLQVLGELPGGFDG